MNPFTNSNSSFRSVVVITFASHAKGPRFETGWKHFVIFNISQCPEASIWFETVEVCLNLAVYLSDLWINVAVFLGTSTMRSV